jgi:hypothetical protein
MWPNFPHTTRWDAEQFRLRHPKIAQRNVRPAVALLVWLMVKDPFATADTYIFPLAASVAAAAVLGVRSGVDPTAITPACFVVTTVEVAPVLRVTVPVAFDRPAAICCMAKMILVRSVSVVPGT